MTCILHPKLQICQQEHQNLEFLPNSIVGSVLEPVGSEHTSLLVSQVSTTKPKNLPLLHLAKNTQTTQFLTKSSKLLENFSSYLALSSSRSKT
ncbi:hypothetical protein BpHYR1_024050 [Brachionus plicatilis]|uniref:Uncharacterized protein n=1 Tax=Brachionus plicatilis TaxID=10195 RepID=A0A3M7SIS1_BRAPC|nr:hypothetical protein BpHYR1_024050 [Brachionus plicatilis]